jgi:hypothetical protein
MADAGTIVNAGNATQFFHVFKIKELLFKSM